MSKKPSSRKRLILFPVRLFIRKATISLAVSALVLVFIGISTGQGSNSIAVATAQAEQQTDSAEEIAKAESFDESQGKKLFDTGTYKFILPEDLERNAESLSGQEIYTVIEFLDKNNDLRAFQKILGNRNFYFIPIDGSYDAIYEGIRVAILGKVGSANKDSVIINDCYVFAYGSDAFQYSLDESDSSLAIKPAHKKMSGSFYLGLLLAMVVIIAILVPLVCAAYDKVRYKTYANRIVNSDVWDLSPTEYEDYVAEYLKAQGWKNVHTTDVTGDFGADVVGINPDGIKCCVQCKMYSSPVGVHAVQEVVGSLAHYKATKAAVFTTSDYTPKARQLARESGVELYILN